MDHVNKITDAIGRDRKCIIVSDVTGAGWTNFNMKFVKAIIKIF